MTFGKTLKELRLTRNMTQENLAELLNISPQAVSRWETGAAMPDISLLPPLARLFRVTTDHLLSIDTYEENLRKKEYDQVCSCYWQYDDKEANYQLAVQAVEEYPGNMDYLVWLAAAEYYVAFLRRGTALEDNTEEYHRLLDSSIKHYQMVLNRTTSITQRNTARNGIVLGYHYKGELEKAKQWAMTEEDESKRNELLIWCLEGEEKRKHCQAGALNHLAAFLAALEHCEKSETVYTNMEQILTICFPDGNLQEFHGLLSHVLSMKALLLCHESRYEETIGTLQKAQQHARQYTLFGQQNHYRYTSPLFDLVGGEKLISNAPCTPLEDFRAALSNNAAYDPIRHRPEFKALMK